MSLSRAHILSLESRRAKEMAQLIRNQQGEPFVAPSMREAPLDRNEELSSSPKILFAGGFDMVILLTGIGTRLLDQVLATRYPEGRFAEALRRVTVVARGPKPVAVLREMNVPATVVAPEPNTWREVLSATEGRPERSIAVQEYGKSNPQLIEVLRSRGAEVTTVRVYQWDLPDDTGPLHEAARRAAKGEFQAALFTTSIQAEHLFRVAADEGLEAQVKEGLNRMMVASIGPTTTEALEDYGVRVDFEPSHPKMGLLVQEAAGWFAKQNSHG